LNTGIVIIGRNEGERLVRCLDSLREYWNSCVYVDSGSSDRSVQEAEARGVSVVSLDMSVPFTAARARNAGARRVAEKMRSLTYVHFFDGDCEVAPTWLEAARQFLDQRPEVGVVFGVQKERDPQGSVYNMLFDVEWDTPRGSVSSCAGNALFRWNVFKQLRGFREDLIAGEDPELCLRVRATGALVWHLDLPMVLHDADMMRFGQWWRRTKRSGFAFAEGAEMHGAKPERHFVRERRSTLFWGLAVPFTIGLMALLFSPWWLLGLLAYPIQVLRIARRGTRGARVNLLYASFIMLGKFPEVAGVLAYHLSRLRHGQRGLIEYK
jgi:GT2 family glycosyltransferase